MNDERRLKLKRIKIALKNSKECIFLENIDDYYYNRHVLDFKYANENGDDADYYKNLIIQRLTTMIKGLYLEPTDFIDESIKQWNDLLENDYKSKLALDPKKYPLSLFDGEKVGCALCNYSKKVAKTYRYCEACPVKWNGGTCEHLVHGWISATDTETRKIFAKEMIKEMTNNRLDR